MAVLMVDCDIRSVTLRMNTKYTQYTRIPRGSITQFQRTFPWGKTATLPSDVSSTSLPLWRHITYSNILDVSADLILYKNGPVPFDYEDN